MKRGAGIFIFCWLIWALLSMSVFGAVEENAPQTSEGLSHMPSIGKVNNLAVFIRFNDQDEFTESISFYDNLFNASSAGANSVYNYYKEASYGQLEIVSHFYPVSNGDAVVSYQDSHPRAYYLPYDANTNPIGYDSNSSMMERLASLWQAAFMTIETSIPKDINLDSNSDGAIDSVTIIARGDRGQIGTIFYPSCFTTRNTNVNINGKSLDTIMMPLLVEQSIIMQGTEVIVHEIGHTIGAPDLYHASGPGDSVALWDVMAEPLNVPPHMGAYMKCRYMGWIASIPEITTPGTYSLSPLTSSTNNCYKIASPYSSSEYFVLEYRQKQGTFESSIPDTGLLVYRINEEISGLGNYFGPPDEVYIYAPGATPEHIGDSGRANFSAEAGEDRTSINDYTNPACFLSDGTPGGIAITNISYPYNDHISFTVSFPGRKNLQSLSISGPQSVYEQQYGIYKAMALWDDGTQTEVAADWSVSPTTNASIGQDGYLDANGVTSSQTVQVSASYSFNGVHKTAVSNVTIVALPSLLDVQILGPDMVNGKGSAQYTLLARYSDGTQRTVFCGPTGCPFSWTVSPKTYASVDGHGMLTATDVPANQTVQVGASYTYGDSTKSATLPVTIVATGGGPEKTLQSLALTGLSLVQEAETGQYAVTASWSDGSQSVITNAAWSLSSTDWASISASGLLTPNDVTADRTVQVLASYTYQGVSKTASMAVTIAATPRRLASLAVSGPAAVGEQSSVRFTATATWDDGSTTDVTPGWSVDPSTDASIGADGTLTTGDVDADQAVRVSASLSQGGITRTASMDVTILAVAQPRTLTGLSIQGPGSVQERKTGQYQALAAWSDGSQTLVSPAWSLDTASYAAIDASGVLTARDVAADQTVQVVASYASGGVTRTAALSVAITDSADTGEGPGDTPGTIDIANSVPARTGGAFSFAPSYTGPGSPASYTWDFGDGTPAASSSAEPVTHVYASAGVHTLTCSALDVLGRTIGTSQTTVIVRTGSVEAAPLQNDHATQVAKTAETYADLSADELRARYAITDPTIRPLRPVSEFTASTSKAGSTAAFRFAVYDLPGQVAMLRLYKLKAGGTNAEYIYGSSADLGVDGHWWITDAQGYDLGQDGSLAAGQTYYVTFTIRDGGPFDADAAPSRIKDPLALARSDTAQPGQSTDTGGSNQPPSSAGGTNSGGGGGGGGCMYDPAAGTAVEILAMLAAAAGVARRCRRRC